MIPEPDDLERMAAFVRHVTPETRLRRAQASAYLTHLGYPVASATLASLVTRGGGPKCQRFGRTVLYQAGPLLEWAQARLSAPTSSSAERAVA